MGTVAGLALPVLGIRNKVIKDRQAFKNQLADLTKPPVIPELPKPPDGPTESSKAAAALRKKARSYQGYTSTLLTGPGGATSVPTVKKSLLGV